MPEKLTIFNQNKQQEMFEINMQQFGLVNNAKNKKKILRQRRKIREKKREDN